MHGNTQLDLLDSMMAPQQEVTSSMYLHMQHLPTSWELPPNSQHAPRATTTSAPVDHMVHPTLSSQVPLSKRGEVW